MAEEKQRQGSCLCGSIRVQIVGEPVSTHLCHCTTCQKLSGCWAGAYLVFKADGVSYSMSDPTLLRVYEDKSAESGGVNRRSFCTNCGSMVRHENDNFGQYMVVPVGIIDGDKEDLKPQVEYYCIRRPSWLVDIGPTTRFEKLPTA